MIRAVSPSDIFTARDIGSLVDPDYSIATSLELDAEGNEVLAFSPRKQTTIHVRLSDGALLDEKRDRLPYPRVVVTETRETAPAFRFVPSEEASCFDGVARIASAQFMARAIERPLPPYLVIARKARIRGRVWVDVVVSETGDVICAQATAMPFGLREAALDAARQWKFTPYEIDGRAVKMTSEMVFRLENVEPEETP